MVGYYLGLPFIWKWLGCSEGSLVITTSALTKLIKQFGNLDLACTTYLTPHLRKNLVD